MPTVSEVKQQVERVWKATCSSAWHDLLEQQMRAAALEGVKVTLEAALREELSSTLHRAPYQRLGEPARRSPPRSGSFTRQVLTSYGPIPDLHVPKLRYGNRERDWHILTRYQRLQNRSLDQLLYLYTLGLSLRDLQEGLYILFGDTLSRQAVNRVSQQVESTMSAWLKQPIPKTPPVVIVDGVWVTINYPTGKKFSDRSGHTRTQVRGQERVVLAVVAVWPDGRHNLLHYQVAEKENAESWGELWQALKARGLDSTQVRLVVSDGSKGILEALAEHLPATVLQRCVVHKVRGLERYLRYVELEQRDERTQQELSVEQAKQQRRSAISADALAVFEAPTRAHAEAGIEAFKLKWQQREPQAVKTLLVGIERCLSFYAFDPKLHRLIRSTNLLERFFREFRGRADEMGAFPNETSCLVVFHLVMLREHAKHDRFKSANTG